MSDTEEIVKLEFVKEPRGKTAAMSERQGRADYRGTKAFQDDIGEQMIILRYQLMEQLITPFGEMKILIDGISVPYDVH